MAIRIARNPRDTRLRSKETKRLFSIKWIRKLIKQHYGRGKNHEETRERRVEKKQERVVDKEL
jgi:hypothetical protein